jgi:GGDEF domain-containing protein
MIILEEGELQFLADHDPLTGLFNRRRFAEELNWVLAYSRRYRSPAALVVIDVDGFKFVNDTFGHATGDEFGVVLTRLRREALQRGPRAGGGCDGARSRRTRTSSRCPTVSGGWLV